MNGPGLLTASALGGGPGLLSTAGSALNGALPTVSGALGARSAGLFPAPPPPPPPGDPHQHRLPSYVKLEPRAAMSAATTGEYTWCGVLQIFENLALCIYCFL